MRGRFKAGLIAAAVVLLLLVGAAAGYARWQLTRAVTEAVLFDVARGSSLSGITDRLIDGGLLKMNPVVLRVYAFVTRGQGPIRAGQYRIEPGMTGPDLLGLFRSGRVVQHRITFPEGWSLEQWLGLLRETPHLGIATAAMTRRQLAAFLGIEGDPEGWLFPDTYQYTKGDTDLEILVLAHDRMRRVLAEEWRGRGAIPQIASVYEALILASIIEKETGFGPDRRRVGSVFHNRLASGMKLQSDPTVIYGLGEDFDGNLTRRDLHRDTPFNTYTRAGLPPMPICSPGRAAIAAAMSGSSHPYFYFVAKGDGRSEFSVSLEEHNKAVDKYQRHSVQ